MSVRVVNNGTAGAAVPAVIREKKLFRICFYCRRGVKPDDKRSFYDENFFVPFFLSALV